MLTTISIQNKSTDTFIALFFTELLKTTCVSVNPIVCTTMVDSMGTLACKIYHFLYMYSTVLSLLKLQNVGEYIGRNMSLMQMSSNH